METENRNKWGKWLILSIGIIFILYSIFLGSLILFGTETKAKITSYRQEYGERNEAIRNQYTYLFGYEFEHNGKKYVGTGQKIGSSIFLKHNDNTFMRVRYLPYYPIINSAYDGNKTILNLLISLFIGIGLMFLTRRM